MKLERLLGILTILLQNDRITSRELAEKFEVSVRTIGRDIDALCVAGIPIVTHKGIGGGVAIAEGFKLDKSVLTTTELSGIVAAIKGIGSVSEQPWVEQTLYKLGANSVVSMHEPVVINLGSHYQTHPTKKIELIRQAILNKQLIQFDYYQEKGESYRCIEPYTVIFQWLNWYVYGFCLQRQDWRLFKLNRLWNLSLDTKRYQPREMPAEGPVFSPPGFIDEIKVAALFDPSAKYQLIESYGVNCYTETDNGLLFEMVYANANRRFLFNWLLGFGASVKVIEPEDFVKDIKTAAEKILMLYK